jgi:cytochrome c553
MRIVISLHLMLQTAVLAIVFVGAGHAGERDRAAFASGGVQGKITYCKDCHGLSAQGYYGYLTMPRLAGQTPEYIENSLRAFADGKRERHFLLNMPRVHGLSPEMRTALAAYFHGLNPPPLGGGAARGQVSLGKTIYQDGLPEANVPACAACHGPEAKGEGVIPRLAGQLYPYLVKELSNWGRERQHESALIMEPIAHGLTQSQITAVAAYVSSLR